MANGPKRVQGEPTRDDHELKHVKAIGMPLVFKGPFEEKLPLQLQTTVALVVFCKASVFIFFRTVSSRMLGRARSRVLTLVFLIMFFFV